MYIGVGSAKKPPLLESESEDAIAAGAAIVGTASSSAIRSLRERAAKPTNGAPAAAPRQPLPKPTFIEREKAKIRLQIRKARAIARKRMPVQVRILTQTRQHLSPLEKYFGSQSIDAALSDIFWASLKGDIRRVRHLVEVEHVSVSDSKLDPWNMQQTPLHWAAKGGSREVIEYLVGAGASVRCLDENGSFPLHIACWAGHIDAALALLKAGDSRDLYVRDFDAAFAPLDWANIRGHTQLLKAVEQYEDSIWLPKFVDDLIRGIIRYKIKLFKPPPKPLKLAVKPAIAQSPVASGDSAVAVEPATAK
ncbi:hypothetical protein PybrP1_005808 [[Pythium] brassicae (nom. inval.)]|nr:hypothetical protein PybrP1_005808 [[Pythium] brassicae (nom. inval.)]